MDSRERSKAMSGVIAGVCFCLIFVICLGAYLWQWMGW